jgi:hypothetical protein
MRCSKAFLLLPIVALLIWPTALNQAQQDSANAPPPAVVTGSLSELRNSRYVLLMVRRSIVVDSRGLAKTILNEAYRTDAETGTRYPYLYNMLARKLNNYMKKYQSISAVRNIPDADFIVFFNLLEYRRPLGFAYPYGEMFVILNKTADGKPPHIIWKTRKSSMWAEHAIEDLIKDLRAVRNEG